MSPIRLHKYKLYDYLLLFTVLVGLIQVTFILEPECIKTFNIRQHETLPDQSDNHGTVHKDFQVKQNLGDLSPNSVKNVQPEESPRLKRKVHPKPQPGKAKNPTKPKVPDNSRSKIDNGEHKVKKNRKLELRKAKTGASEIGRKSNQITNNSNIGNDSNVVKLSSPTKIKTTLQKYIKKETAAQGKVTKCQNRSILIYGGIKVIRQWKELNQLVKALKPLDNGDWSTEASCDSCAVQLILSNRPGSIKGKDAAVFGMSPFSLKVKMALFRTYEFDPGQLLIFYGVETPLRMRKWIPDVGSTPNHVVWSYSKTADIQIPYGVYKTGTPLDSKHKKASDRIRGKRKLIAWMGSNCVKEVFWPRMDFVWKLQSHIQVDVYGRCGNLTCLPRLSEECQNLMGQYKFYLSLENAECDDYVTEKFWETALMHGAVPVVYGAPKQFYLENAPPNSFIYAGDFKTPKELANFLTRLDKNPQQYARYFEWRYRGTVVENFPDLKLSHFCDLLPSIVKAAKMQMKSRLLSDTPWFNSCRNMREGEGAFLPTDVNITSWVPW